MAQLARAREKRTTVRPVARDCAPLPGPWRTRWSSWKTPSASAPPAPD